MTGTLPPALVIQELVSAGLLRRPDVHFVERRRFADAFARFVPAGRRPLVRIRAEERERFVRVWVEDNGVGVPPGQEERIFGVFERLNESATRPGTGIGLAIVRRGMERMGGRAGVTRAAESEGSRFWVDVPRVDGPPRPGLEDAGGDAQAECGRGHCILLGATSGFTPFSTRAHRTTQWIPTSSLWWRSSWASRSYSSP